MPRRVIGEYVRAVLSSGRNARFYLAGLFLCGLGQSIFALLFNLYLRELGLNDAGIGQILSKASLGAAVAALPIAFLFRRLSTRAILVGAGALTAVAYTLQGTLVAPELLLFAAFLSGMVVTTFRLSIAPVIMREVAPPIRPYLFSAAFTVLFLASIVGSILGGLMPHAFQGMTPSATLALRWSLYAACGLTLLAAIPFYRMSGGPGTPEPGAQATVSPWDQLRELAEVDWGLQLKLALPATLIGLGAGLIIPFLNLYFRDRFGLTPAAIGILFAVMQGFMVVGNLFGPAVSKRLGLVRGVVATQLASVPFMLALALSGSFPVVVASFFLRGGLMNMNQPLTTHFAMEMVPEREHAITNSLLTLSWYVAWSVSADIGGALIQRRGYTEPLLLAAGLYVAASILYALFFHSVPEVRVPRSEVEIPDA
ncbi:MAG TPA: MFS transporter [Candidatus Binatia bacterium]|nr:MFS transporter [Candidatus Binatia bacterium]